MNNQSNQIKGASVFAQYAAIQEEYEAKADVAITVSQIQQIPMPAKAPLRTPSNSRLVPLPKLTAAFPELVPGTGSGSPHAPSTTYVSFAQRAKELVERDRIILEQQRLEQERERELEQEHLYRCRENLASVGKRGFPVLPKNMLTAHLRPERDEDQDHHTFEWQEQEEYEAHLYANQQDQEQEQGRGTPEFGRYDHLNKIEGDQEVEYI